MIDLYTWPTPNGHKIHIMLEETGTPYKVHPVAIGKGEQFAPDFLKISPNNKMPAMVDPNGPDGQPISLFESGAMLIYLAEKTGQFLPTDPTGRYTTLAWLMWQMGGIGPFLGQAHHFLQYAQEEVAYARDRYQNEAKRLYGVADKRLGESRFLAGDEITIADFACWPWMRRPWRQGVEREDYPNYLRWFEEIDARPAVKRAVQVLAEHQSSGPMTAEERENLFGAKQYARR